MQTCPMRACCHHVIGEQVPLPGGGWFLRLDMACMQLTSDACVINSGLFAIALHMQLGMQWETLQGAGWQVRPAAGT